MIFEYFRNILLWDNLDLQNTNIYYTADIVAVALFITALLAIKKDY